MYDQTLIIFLVSSVGWCPHWSSCSKEFPRACYQSDCYRQWHSPERHQWSQYQGINSCWWIGGSIWPQGWVLLFWRLGSLWGDRSLCWQTELWHERCPPNWGEPNTEANFVWSCIKRAATQELQVPTYRNHYWMKSEICFGCRVIIESAGKSYEECLKSNRTFLNPSVIEYMSEALGLDIQSSNPCSFLKGLK